MEDWKGLYLDLERMLDERFGELRKTAVKNLAHLVVGLVVALRGPRGWYGKLSLSGIARCMCTDGKVESRYKRLHRFLDNPHFKMEQLSGGVLRMVLGEASGELVPLLVDQTAVGDVQVLTGSYAVEGRAIPIGMSTFEYGEMRRSQNTLEEGFLEKLAASVPEGKRAVWIMDRGYGRASLLRFCRKRKWLYIIRGRRDVTVEYTERGKVRRIGLGRLKHRQGVARRYRGVLYHGELKEKVDVIIYRERGFKEPWFLVVPSGQEKLLPTELVVKWYKSRMKIEVSFRDFKSWLGVRGLRLKVRKAERLRRLLAGLVICYVLLLTLGGSRLGRQLRSRLEIVRRRARHGTRRTLSILSIALTALTDSFLLSRGNVINVLADCLLIMRKGRVLVPASSG